jgi:hypothetical protein
MRVCRSGYNQAAAGPRRGDFPNNFVGNDMARAAVDGWGGLLERNDWASGAREQVEHSKSGQMSPRRRGRCLDSHESNNEFAAQTSGAIG